MGESVTCIWSTSSHKYTECISHDEPKTLVASVPFLPAFPCTLNCTHPGQVCWTPHIKGNADIGYISRNSQKTRGLRSLSAKVVARQRQQWWLRLSCSCAQHSEMSPGLIKTEVDEFLLLRPPWSQECLISI